MKATVFFIVFFKLKLEDTARYAGLLLAPAEGFGLWPRPFLPFGQKKELIMKRSRARVTIGGQCVLLQNSLKIKLFDFFFKSQNYRMNHIFPDILLNP